MYLEFDQTIPYTWNVPEMVYHDSLLSTLLLLETSSKFQSKNSEYPTNYKQTIDTED